MSKENPKEINRRDFLRVVGGLAVGVLVAARLPELWIPPSAQADEGRQGALRGRGRKVLPGSGRGVPERLPGADLNLGFEIPDPRSNPLEPLGWDGITPDLTRYVLNDGSGSQRSVAVWGQFTDGVPTFGAWRHEVLTPVDPNSAMQLELDAKWGEGLPPFVELLIEYLDPARERIGLKVFSSLMQGAVGQWGHYNLGTIEPRRLPVNIVSIRRTVRMSGFPLNFDPNGRTTEVLIDNVT